MMNNKTVDEKNFDRRMHTFFTPLQTPDFMQYLIPYEE